MATNFKEAYQELIKYLYNNIEDQDIYDNWMSFQLRELTELIEKLENQSLKFEKHYVKPCKDSEFHGINCLQMDDGNKFGFFNSEADVSLDAKKKIWNPNRETAVNLVGLWGLETDGWVGNKVLCSIVENKVVGVPIKDVATAPAVEEKVVDTTAPVVAPPIPPSDAEIKAQED